MRNFITQRPIWFAIAITLFNFLLGLLIFIVGSTVGLSEVPLRMVAVTILAAVPLVLIGWLGWWQDTGFVTTTQNVPGLAVALIEALLALAWFGTVEFESELVILVLVSAFLTGLSEESLSRGLLLRALLPRGKWQAVLIPSVLFGVSHVTQFVFLGMPLADNLIQIANATVVGFLYAGLRLRVNNIWPLVILHMLHNTFFTVTGLHMGGVPAVYWAVDWGLMLIGGIYVVLRPATATIDGQVAG